MLLSRLTAIGKRIFDPPRRPPGPTALDIKREGRQQELFWSIDYPLKMSQQFGGFVYFAQIKRYIVTSPEGFEYIIKTNQKNYERSRVFYNFRMRPLFGKSLLTTTGEEWKYRRKNIQAAYQKTCLRQYIPIIIKHTEKYVEDLKQQKSKKIIMLSEMGVLTLNIAFEIFCSKSFSRPFLNKLGKSIAYCNRYSAHAIFIKWWKPSLSSIRFFLHMSRINKVLLEIVRERRKNPQEKSDLLNILINSRNSETHAPLTDSEILDEFKTHLVTGHETSATGLTWTFYLLAKNHHYREKMEAEFKEVLNGRAPEMEDMEKLPLTRAIISESFRLYPPVWAIARGNIKDDVYLGYDIPANSFILLHLYALHRNPSVWEKPDEFYPERFLEGAPERHPFAYLPFFSGAHTCIAHQFAPLEMTIILGVICQQLRFDMLNFKQKVIPQTCITLRPKGGIKMRWRLRAE